jgi:hypothetical protein
MGTSGRFGWWIGRSKVRAEKGLGDTANLNHLPEVLFPEGLRDQLVMLSKGSCCLGVDWDLIATNWRDMM